MIGCLIQFCQLTVKICSSKRLGLLFFLQANGTARELQKRVDQLERLNADLRAKLDELNGLYEAAQRDNRTKQTQIQQLTHELDKTREQKEYMARENKKLAGK